MNDVNAENASIVQNLNNTSASLKPPAPPKQLLDRDPKWDAWDKTHKDSPEWWIWRREHRLPRPYYKPKPGQCYTGW
jgi:hypothetical protein